VSVCGLLWPADSNEYVAPGWTEAELRRFMRYWSRQNWLSAVPFEEYKRVYVRRGDCAETGMVV